MNRITLCVAAVALTFLPTSVARAEKTGARDMDAAAAAMDAATQPGEAHAFLAGMEGSWTLTTRVWMIPGQPPESSKGTSKKRMIMGGRYLQDQTHTEMMGSPFAGFGVTGYDNAAREFVGTWIDNMSTAIVVSKGQRDGDTLTMTGSFLDPVSGEQVSMRQVTRIVDPDRHVFELYMTMPGLKEQKSMEMEYARAEEATD